MSRIANQKVKPVPSPSLHPIPILDLAAPLRKRPVGLTLHEAWCHYLADPGRARTRKKAEAGVKSGDLALRHGVFEATIQT